MPDETVYPTADDLVPAAGKAPEDSWIEGDHPTDNPDGVTVSNTDYWPKTQEEKAARLDVPMAQDVDVSPDAPYPIGDPINEEQAFEQLTRMQPPMNLVPSDDYQTAAEKNLKAGGSVDQEELKRLRNAL